MLRTAILAMFLAACANDRSRNKSLGADACEHIAEGPIKTVTTAAAPADAPDLALTHTRWDITLSGSGDARGGFLKVVVAAAGDYAFVFASPVQLTVTDGGGQLVAPTSSAGFDSNCATVQAEIIYSLAVGTYVFEL